VASLRERNLLQSKPRRKSDIVQSHKESRMELGGADGDYLRVLLLRHLLLSNCADGRTLRTETKQLISKTIVVFSNTEVNLKDKV